MTKILITCMLIALSSFGAAHATQLTTVPYAIESSAPSTIFDVTWHPTNPQQCALYTLNQGPQIRLIDYAAEKSSGPDNNYVAASVIAYPHVSLNTHNTLAFKQTPHALTPYENTELAEHIQLYNITTQKSMRVAVGGAAILKLHKQQNLFAVCKPYSGNNTDVISFDDNLLPKLECTVSHECNSALPTLSWNPLTTILATAPKPGNQVALWSIVAKKMYTSWQTEHQVIKNQWNSEGTQIMTSVTGGKHYIRNLLGHNVCTLDKTLEQLDQTSNWEHDTIALFGGTKAELWNSKEGIVQATIIEDAPLTHISIRPQGTIIACATQNEMLTFYNSTGDFIQKNHTGGRVISLSWNADGSMLGVLCLTPNNCVFGSLFTPYVVTPMKNND